MIKVVVINNLKRETKMVSNEATPRQVFEEAGIDYSRAMANMDGVPLGPGDLDKSFASFGITDHTYLSAIVKQDNA